MAMFQVSENQTSFFLLWRLKDLLGHRSPKPNYTTELKHGETSQATLRTRNRRDSPRPCTQPVCNLGTKIQVIIVGEQKSKYWGGPVGETKCGSDFEPHSGVIHKSQFCWKAASGIWLFSNKDCHDGRNWRDGRSQFPLDMCYCGRSKLWAAQGTQSPELRAPI